MHDVLTDRHKQNMYTNKQIMCTYCMHVHVHCMYVHTYVYVRWYTLPYSHNNIYSTHHTHINTCTITYTCPHLTVKDLCMYVASYNTSEHIHSHPHKQCIQSELMLLYLCTYVGNMYVAKKDNYWNVLVTGTLSVTQTVAIDTD